MNHFNLIRIKYYSNKGCTTEPTVNLFAMGLCSVNLFELKLNGRSIFKLLFNR